MEMRTLAGSQLTVSALSMGTANFGTGISPEQAFAHMDRYVELGGNFLDTALKRRGFQGYYAGLP